MINMAQTYLLIDKNTNVCDNAVVWDGDTETWTPPANSLALAKDTTSSKVWTIANDNETWVLTETVGSGDIGFTWDGEFLITSQPQPAQLVQPTVVGAQTL